MTFDFFSERREVVTAPYNSFVLEDGVITRYQKRKITKVANYGNPDILKYPVSGIFGKDYGNHIQSSLNTITLLATMPVIACLVRSGRRFSSQANLSQAESMTASSVT